MPKPTELLIPGTYLRFERDWPPNLSFPPYAQGTNGTIRAVFLDNPHAEAPDERIYSYDVYSHATRRLTRIAAETLHKPGMITILEDPRQET